MARKGSYRGEPWEGISDEAIASVQRKRYGGRSGRSRGVHLSKGKAKKRRAMKDASAAI